MKKISKSLCCISLFVLCLCLNACEASKKEPEDEMIKEDLIRELSSYDDRLSFNEYSVEKSLTEDKEYTATLIVSAKNTFSEHQVTAEVKYVLYDQGWKIEECQWTNDVYTVVSYPTVDEMSELIKDSQELVQSGLNEQQDVSVQPNGNSLTCEGVIEKKDNPYYTYKGKILTYWDYNANADAWKYSNTETGESKCELTSALQLDGTWESMSKTRESDPSTYITVSNYDMNSLDISSEMFNTNTVHAQLEECSLSEYGVCNVIYKGNGLSYSLNDGTTRENIDFTVCVLIGKDFIQLQLQIEDPEHQDLTDDIADIERK